jgi:hypothetical protein
MEGLAQELQEPDRDVSAQSMCAEEAVRSANQGVSSVTSQPKALSPFSSVRRRLHVARFWRLQGLALRLKMCGS